MAPFYYAFVWRRQTAIIVAQRSCWYKSAMTTSRKRRSVASAAWIYYHLMLLSCSGCGRRRCYATVWRAICRLRAAGLAGLPHANGSGWKRVSEPLISKGDVMDKGGQLQPAWGMIRCPSLEHRGPISAGMETVIFLPEHYYVFFCCGTR